MAQVPASSRGLSTNGGAILGPLAVTDATAGDVALDVVGGAAGNGDAVIRLRNAALGQLLEVDSDGTTTVYLAGGTTFGVQSHLGAGLLSVDDSGNVGTKPPASEAATLTLGAAYQHSIARDVLLTVYLSVTVNTSGVLKLGVGPTNTPTQQTLVTGLTATGLWPVPIYLPASYYALLSVSGTITVAVDGQIAMPI